MNRFRKKPEPKRSRTSDSLNDSDVLPGLPPASNFRTSLILPDLSRRFTLLRTSSGNPLSLDDLRTRFAEQRVRGEENQVSIEEEDMILETLDRIRSNNASNAGMSFGDSPRINTDYQFSNGRQSSTTTISTTHGSMISSPISRSTKRYSNNIFGSGQFRDETYLRSVVSQRSGSQRNAISIAPTEPSVEDGASPGLDIDRPTTPEDSAMSSSVQSTPEYVNQAHSAPATVSSDHPASVAEYRLSRVLGPAVFRRASLALQQVIKEIEEEVEEEIVMPRSAPPGRTVMPDPNRSPTDGSDSSVQEEGTAISSDRQVVSEDETPHSAPPQGRTISPTPRLPGYIPGMPRPMTPRNLPSDSDDLSRSHSTTPRATSPLLNDNSSSAVPGLMSELLRRDSDASYSPRPTSPSASSPFQIPRSVDGNSHPNDHQRSGEFDSSPNSSILHRQRPSSPLSGNPYLPMKVSSRPGTPSNITWNPSPSPQKSQGGHESMGHSSNGSWVSDIAAGFDIQGNLGRSKSTTTRYPAIPDSPLIDRAHDTSSPFTGNVVPDSTIDDSPSAALDLGSIPMGTRVIRSPTPTSHINVTRSPTSPTFSNYDSSSVNGSPRTSRRTAKSSSFSLGPYNPLVFSPVANSSRSSLESEGSSYHSLDGHHKDRAFNLINGIDSPQNTWHDVIPADSSNSATPGDAQDEAWDAEAVIDKWAGLTKGDFMAIQEKLVGAAVAKNSTPDLRDRAPSLRRRRPSTSQSNYSFNGRDTKVVSPLHTIIATPLVSPTPNADKSSKASALLDSVVDSILSPAYPPAAVGETETATPASPSQEGVSPTTRRNRDLAQALFGAQDRDWDRKVSAKPSLSQSATVPPAVLESVAEVASHSLSAHPSDSFSEDTEVPMTSPLKLRHQSTPKSPQASVNQAELAREVQRKTDAAMLALKRTTSRPDSVRTGSISRRRVSPAQISNPKLVSASTSVDTIPLRSPSVSSGNAQTTSRLGQRFKRITGTLRARVPAQSDEMSASESRTPPSSQTAYYDPSRLRVPGEPPAITSATEVGRFKVPVPSPPASAGPGLRGFMARFLKPRTNDPQVEQERGMSPQIQPTSPSPSLATPQARSAPLPPRMFSPSPEPALNPGPPHRHPRSTPPPSLRPATNIDTFQSIPATITNDTPATNGTDDDAALKQLFAAAVDLGLDQGALNDLLVRSNSTRSTTWTMLTRNNSSSTNARYDQTPDGNVQDSVYSPVPSDGRPSLDTISSRTDDGVVRKPSARRATDHLRRPRNNQDESTAAFNAVVRRTIIFPSESKSATIDLNVLMRKHSQSSRRRRSAGSVGSASTRSVHDRVPTPPPPRSPTGHRFSTDSSPPVPQLPPSFSSHSENLLQPQSAPAGPIEKSNSTYDSLYEMYAGDNKSANSVGNDASRRSNADGVPGSESGPALEVIEMANGQTIWSIVNGLRDDDAESSYYDNRTSFASEYSLREPNGSNGDSVQVFVKEHSAKGGNNPAFLSRKKSQAKPRPETKVFYSSSAQIGRLIENLSQGMEAGSFNILPQGHSYTNSVHSDGMHWTVEEQLDHMLGTMGNN